MGEERDTFAAVVLMWLWDVEYFVEPYQSELQRVRVLVTMNDRIEVRSTGSTN